MSRSEQQAALREMEQAAQAKPKQSDSKPKNNQNNNKDLDKSMKSKYKPNVRQSVNFAVQLADQVIETIKKKTITGLLLTPDELKNADLAQTIIMKARELSIKQKLASSAVAQASRELPANTTVNNLITSASTEELKALLEASKTLQGNK
jgi:hypothetical protein